MLRGKILKEGAEKVVEKAGEDAIELLSRYGTSSETSTRLVRLAAEEEKIGFHGVSTTTKLIAGAEGASQALKSEVEQFFKVIKTGPPHHWTVELPKHVIKEVADSFNKLFGRQK